MSAKNILNGEIKNYFDAIKFRWFSHQELVELKQHLQKSIEIGLDRKGQGYSYHPDGGVAALPSYVSHINSDQVTAIADGAVAITAACGGTNWIFTLARKQGDGKVILEESLSQPIPESARTHTFDSLVDLIAKNVLKVARQYNVLETKPVAIAISFGFPQQNIRLENGDIDARIMTKELPKKWVLSDCDETLPAEKQPSFANGLREKLAAGGMTGVGAITIINDTVAVALDVQEPTDLPAGFVFGTGTNGAMDSGTEKGIVNLEAGHALFPADEIWRAMRQLGYTKTEPVYEDWMGGGMLPYRIAGALQLASNQFETTDRWTKMFLNTENQALISHLAAGDFSDLKFSGATEEEKDLLRSVSRRALTQAGQVIGVTIAAVVSQLGYEDGEASFLYEGSLMKMGFEVQTTAMDTLDFLIPGHQLRPVVASGMIGVAKLAMVITHDRHK